MPWRFKARYTIPDMALYRHLLVLPIPDPQDGKIRDLMDKIAAHTGLSAPHVKLPPHVTVYRPLTGMDETLLVQAIEGVVQKNKPTSMILGDLFPFGKHHVVLPVYVTRALAALWLDLNKALAGLPGYEADQYDNDNILHVTVAAKTSDVFEKAWPAVRNISVPSLSMPVRGIELYRKPAGEGKWEKIRTFSLG